MQFFLTKGLAETVPFWSDVQAGYEWVYRAAHILTNAEKQNAVQVHQLYEELLGKMEQTSPSSSTLITMIAAFRKVTMSYWSGLFHCYDIADLPRTNNDLEQYFGSARYHERRATGRKSASPGLVVRGSVRVVTSVASRLHHFDVTELRLTDPTQWRTLRSELDDRHEARRRQHHFRKSPENYLTILEEKLIKERLPS